MVSFATFEAELTRNEPGLVEKGMTSSLPDFDHLMYAAVKRKNLHYTEKKPQN